MAAAPGSASVAYVMEDRHLVIIDAAVPAVVTAVILVGLSLSGGASARPLSLALGVGAGIVLAARRRWPGWTLAGSGVLVAVLVHVNPSAAVVAVLAPAVALYSLALRRGRTQQLVAGAVAVAAVITADLLHGGLAIGQTIAHCLLVAVPLLAAEVIRTHQANVRLLVERLKSAEQAREQEAQRRTEQERIRIARELHDVVAHTLTEVNVTAAAAAERAPAGEARTALEHIERSSHDAIGELRGILGVLRERDSADPPHGPAPGVDDIAELICRARTAGLDVRLDIAGSPPTRPSEATSLAAYRIVQESLTNVRRHAPGATAAVTVRYDTVQLELTVDNGPGDAPVQMSTEPGVGIIGMRERANAVGGRLSAGPCAAGFRVHADLPYQPNR